MTVLIAVGPASEYGAGAVRGAKESSKMTAQDRPTAAPALEPTARSKLHSFIREVAPDEAAAWSQAEPPSGPRLRSVQTGPLDATAARALVEALVDAGVETFFGIPGGPVSPVFDAVLTTSRARLVESRHETSAAFAAAGYYRATGKVPAVIVTAGPGATNAVTGIASAHLERVPMLVLCGDVAWSSGGGRLLQDSGPEGIHVEQMLGKFVRATVRVAQPRSAATQGLAALDAATDPARPGPALLVIPIDAGAAEAAAPRVARAHVTRVATPPLEAVFEVAQALCDASRPLVVLGAGCRPHAARMRRLVDALDVPFATTPQAKGIVSELHPRSLRHGGLGASRWVRAYTQEGVDVALVLGTDLDDCSIGATPYVRPGGKLVHVDLDASVFNRNLPADLSVVADVGAFADALYGVVAEHGLRNGRTAALMRELRVSSPFDDPRFAEDDSVAITPARAIADLQRAAGSGARFVSDIGEHMLFALHYLTAEGPDAFDLRLSLGSMGSGIAGAIGAAIGDRSRRVVCVCGDGGMQMVGMEALVAVRERLPVVFAVFNDARYNMVFHGYRQVFGREAAWDTPWIDFAGWARSIGMPALRIHRPGEIDAPLLAHLAAGGGPALLDIRIDRDERLSGAGRNEALLRMSMARS
jgi:acetolactate synthase-1/2/3 large subunit